MSESEKQGMLGISEANPSRSTKSASKTTEGVNTCSVACDSSEHAKRAGTSEQPPVSLMVLNQKTRWWLQVEIGDFRTRALHDPGISCTVMGKVGLQPVVGNSKPPIEKWRMWRMVER